MLASITVFAGWEVLRLLYTPGSIRLFQDWVLESHTFPQKNELHHLFFGQMVLSFYFCFRSDVLYIQQAQRQGEIEQFVRVVKIAFQYFFDFSRREAFFSKFHGIQKGPV